MQLRSIFTSAVVLLLYGSTTFGHGIPIRVSLDTNNKLAISAGIPDSVGFAPMLFAQSGEEFGEFGEPLARDFPLPIDDSTYVLYDVPGLDFVGLDPRCDISLEVLNRPVQGTFPLEHRTLWYWSESNGVVPAPVEKLVVVAEGPTFLTITPTDTVAPPPLLVTDELGVPQPHSHSFLKYAIDNTPTAPEGVYGFFARFTSTFCDETTGCYSPSDPLLIVFNRDVTDYDLIDDAARAINAAAKAPQTPGDYDNNGHVEPDDYLFWRERFGNAVTPFTSPDGSGNGIVDAADYVVWRNAFSSPAASAFTLHAVPESSTLSSLAAAFCCAAIQRRGSRRRMLPPACPRPRIR